MDTVFQDQAKHIPVEEPHEKVQATGQVMVESVDSSEETDTENSEEEMVVR